MVTISVFQNISYIDVFSGLSDGFKESQIELVGPKYKPIYINTDVFQVNTRIRLTSLTKLNGGLSVSCTKCSKSWKYKHVIEYNLTMVMNLDDKRIRFHNLSDLSNFYMFQKSTHMLRTKER